MPHSFIVKAYKETVKKKRKTNFVDSEQVMSKPKASKKSKSSMKDYGAGPMRHAKKDDEMLPGEEINFHIWSELENDMCGAT